MDTTGIARGGCLCGAVTFEAELPSLWVAHCHCAMCRLAHGAAFVTWVGLRAERLRFTSGEERVRWYASSPGAGRGFCRDCGSTMFFRSDRWPGEIHVTRAHFGDPVDRQPQAHVFYDAHVDWFEVADGLPRKPAPSM